VALQEKPELLSSEAGLGAAVAAEHGALDGGAGGDDIVARGYWEQVWRRFRRDKVALGAAGFIVFLILAAFPGAWFASHQLGHSPEDLFLPYALDERQVPVGPMTHVQTLEGDTTLFILGADSTLGRDAFLRLLYGARVSLEVALFSTIGVMLLGVILGSIAGYYRGWIDTLVSRLSEVVMAFPVLLFYIALASTIGPRLNDLTLGGVFAPGVATLVIIFTMFGWYYPARIMRAQVLSLREKEFVEAARMVGASDTRIIRSHVLPHLVAPILVYSTLIIAQYVLAEAGLSFLGVGIEESVPSWGNMLAQGPNFYTVQPWLMVWPGLAVLFTTLAFNLLGDGLRDSFDPRATH
jgi:ABC-type dipeptide/oligopeptide/nickel transport system permease subunit